MAKKALLLLLALSLAAPSVLACDCCPASASQSSPASPAEVRSRDCDCCPDAVDNQDPRQTNLFRYPEGRRPEGSEILRYAPDDVSADCFVPACGRAARSESPPSFSKTPLHLLLQILRL